MTTLYIIRHAQSEGNDEGRMQGRTDRALSELGRRQLEPLARRCSGIEAVHMYTSPLRRARDTALAANRHLSLPLTMMDSLMEIDVGEWENQLVSDIERRWPQARKIWNEAHYLFVAPGGETMQEVYNRVRGALLDIAARHPGQSVIVVSHGCAIRNMVAWALGGPRQANEQIWVGNTALSRIDIDEAGRPVHVFHGDDSHLEDLRSPLDQA